MTRVVACLDGFDPDYLSAVDTPHWDRIAEVGDNGTCECVMPSLTNVNNVSITTAAFPREHGITGNSYYDRETDELVYMRTAEFRRTDTWLQTAADRGDTVAALGVKEKLERLIGEGCDYTANAESPPADLEAAIGPAPDIYSGDASAWILEAATHLLDDRDIDVLYVSTTDVVPHKHAPDEAVAHSWVRTLDEAIGALADRAEKLVATADHGMREKTHCVDIEAILAAEGIDAEVVRLIRDAHTYHHRNLGGAAYVYLDDSADGQLLADVDGVEVVLDRETAAEEFSLPTEYIGDLMVLGTPASVFGPVDDAEAGDPNGFHADVSLRSHGSHHERTVPWVSTESGPLESNNDAWSLLA